MGRYMVELGMTPAARSRVAGLDPRMQLPGDSLEFRTVYETKPIEAIEVSFVATTHRQARSGAMTATGRLHPGPRGAVSLEFRARWYQKAFHQALVGDACDRAIAIWHRRAGKDEVVLHGFRDLSIKRIGTYWHCLPAYAQARKALWTAINAHTGKRRIDEIFPPECRETTREQEMFIQFKWGSTWQLIGSDAYDATVGAGPVGIAYSEWALANPSAWAYHRPMLEESRGKAAFITTPRGNNHAKAMLDMAKASPRWFAEVLERGGHRRAVAAAARRGAGRVSGALRHRLRPRLLRAGVPLQLLRRDGRRLLRGRDGAGRARGPGGRGAGRRAAIRCTRSGTWGARSTIRSGASR